MLAGVDPGEAEAAGEADALLGEHLGDMGADRLGEHSAQQPVPGMEQGHLGACGREPGGDLAADVSAAHHGGAGALLHQVAQMAVVRDGAQVRHARVLPGAETARGGAGREQQRPVADGGAVSCRHGVRRGVDRGDGRPGVQVGAGLLGGVEVLGGGIGIVAVPQVLGQCGAVDGSVGVGREDRDRRVRCLLVHRSGRFVSGDPATDDHVVVAALQIGHGSAPSSNVRRTVPLHPRYAWAGRSATLLSVAAVRAPAATSGGLRETAHGR